MLYMYHLQYYLVVEIQDEEDNKATVHQTFYYFLYIAFEISITILSFLTGLSILTN